MNPFLPDTFLSLEEKPSSVLEKYPPNAYRLLRGGNGYRDIAFER